MALHLDTCHLIEAIPAENEYFELHLKIYKIYFYKTLWRRPIQFPNIYDSCDYNANTG